MVAPVDVALVSLWGGTVGAVAWLEDRGYAVFEYDPDFLARKLEVSPIHMPLEEALANEATFGFPNLSRQSFRGLPGLLADCLPDKFGNAVIDQWLARQGRSRDGFSPVERLCYMGKRGMGALEFKPSLAKNVDRAVPVDIREMAGLAREILLSRTDLNVVLGGSDKKKAEALTDILRVGTSAGGARAKAVIAISKETGSILSGQAEVPEGYDHWILKFDGVSGDELGPAKGYGRIECAYARMAEDCGMEMMESLLLKEHGRAHFLTRRFDRVGGRKVHMQSLCGLAHFDFNLPGAYSYEQAFQTMRRMGLPYADAERLFRRMALNVVARNQDDHTKNISFLMGENGRWSLSPAYDVIYAYNPGGGWTASHQMTVNGKRDGLAREDILAVGRLFNIRRPGEILDRVVDSVARWPDFAKAEGVPQARAAQIGSTHRLGLGKSGG